MAIGQRNTRQRRLVTAALAQFDDFRSAQEIHEALARQGDQVGRATVYRTLRAMSVAGDADVIVRADGETVYRSCTPNHHHHLVCRSCGATVAIVGPVVEAVASLGIAAGLVDVIGSTQEIERWSNATAASHGYDEVSHTLEVFGRCRACRDTARAAGQGASGTAGSDPASRAS